MKIKAFIEEKKPEKLNKISITIKAVAANKPPKLFVCYHYEKQFNIGKTKIKIPADDSEALRALKDIVFYFSFCI